MLRNDIEKQLGIQPSSPFGASTPWIRGAVAAAIWFVTLGLVPNCRHDDLGLDAVALDDESDAEAGTTGFDERTIRYQLSWNALGVERPKTGGLVLTNELGYSVHITNAYLHNTSVSLVPCVASEERGDSSSLLRLLQPAVAEAGHGSRSVDPSLVLLQRVETLPALNGLTSETSLNIGEHRTNARSTYCQLHYLVSRGTTDQSGRSGGVSLAIKGFWTHPSQSVQSGPVAFSIRSSLANGAMIDLEQPLDVMGAGPSNESLAPVIITVERPLGRLFSGVELNLADASTLERAVLRNIFSGVRVTVRD